MKQNISERQSAFFTIACKYFGELQFGVHKETVPATNGMPQIKGWCLTVPALRRELNEQRAAIETDLITCRQHNANSRNIFIRPCFDVENNFLLLDDMNRKKMEIQRNLPGRLIVETSPENYQIWLKLAEPLDVIGKEFHIAQHGADGGATPLHRWGRAPGFVNRKHKYASNPPWARFVCMTEGEATLPEVSEAWRAEKGNEMPAITYSTVTIPIKLPKREKYASTTSDESVADFKFALALIRYDMSDEVIAAAIAQQRENWSAHSNNIDRYLSRTVAKARAYASQTALPRTKERSKVKA